MKKIGIFMAIAVAIAMTALAAGTAGFEGSGDGASGPWADSVEAFSQGLRNNGTAVLLERSDPTSALDVAENDTASGHFVSLGFGGSITLGFENYICNGTGDDIELVEATNETYPDERVDVYVSQDNVNFVLAASAVNKDATVPLPDDIAWAKYVKLVDVTNPQLHDATADAYDLDGIRAIHSSASGCSTTVSIDIKPGSYPNSINLCEKGTVPVAVFGCSNFNVMKIDLDTVRFAGAPIAKKPNGVPMYSFKDINNDCITDLVAHFNAQELELDGSSTQATLTGKLTTGQNFSGTDTVNIVKADCDKPEKDCQPCSCDKSGKSCKPCDKDKPDKDCQPCGCGDDGNGCQSSCGCGDNDDDDDHYSFYNPKLKIKK